MLKYLPVIALLFFVSAVGLAGCATAPKPEPVAAAVVDDKPVTWDPVVLADFEAKVPKYVRGLARQKMEEMARERGTYLVDRALYDEAMAKYGQK